MEVIVLYNEKTCEYSVMASTEDNKDIAKIANLDWTIETLPITLSHVTTNELHCDSMDLGIS